VFGLSHTSAMPGAHIMAAVPLLVDDSARLVPKVRFDEFPNIAAKLFEALIMFVNDRMRVMSEYELQRANEVCDVSINVFYHFSQLVDMLIPGCRFRRMRNVSEVL
jgi:hypothetical protein